MIESSFPPPSILMFETPTPTASAPRLSIYCFANEADESSSASEVAAQDFCSGWHVSALEPRRDIAGVVSLLASDDPDAILLDARRMMSAEASGIGSDDVVYLVEALREHASLRALPLLVLLPQHDDARAVACAQAGVDNSYCEPVQREVLTARLDSLRRQRELAAGDVTERIVLSLLCAAEAKDFRQRRHAERVASYADQISNTLNLPPLERMTLRHGALLHDVGNIGIADSILLKPGGLSDWEFDEVRLHPIIGEQICKPLRSLSAILPMVRSHHEKLDGSGYPDGLRGDQISFLVRVLSVIDVYDTLRSDRVYRGAFGHDDALDILNKEAERGWWDSEVVALLDTLTAPDKDFPLV